MKATLLLKERHAVNKQAFAELLVWKVPDPLRGSAHLFKYSLAYIVLGECVLRYDNERGKGDHHVGDVETPYSFLTPARLLADFWADVDNWSPS
ncbi:toxin-antitoxin system TumE family protein [Caballeronia sp.]|uniref:toxin-antitoxin system TumE family protein n=1 Tax=Caballeronia sp. TaxID=1931223 RepID=UPI003C6BA293